MECEVLRPFRAADGMPPLQIGDRVDADTLPNGRYLIEAHFLKPTNRVSRCVILRPFPNDPPVQIGEVVDTTGWKNADRLIRSGYLKPLDDAEGNVEKPKPEPKRRKRK